jgi:hypothetical protein
MLSDNWPKHVAVLSEDRGFALELADVMADGFRDHGCIVDVLNRTEPWERAYDLVLGYGPHTREGSLLPTALRLLSYDSETRPFFCWWYTEAVSRPDMTAGLVRLAARLHAAGGLYLLRHSADGNEFQARVLKRLFLNRHFRLGILGELHAFRSRGLLGTLVATSQVKAAQLRRHGFEPIVAPIGFHPTLHGSDLGINRDIDVAFLGRIHTKRRLKLLTRLRRDLAKHGIKVAVPEGEVDGTQRIRFLNRAKIVLNIFQNPHDFVGLRAMFCAANKALMVSEPPADEKPFVPGQHIVTAPIEKLAETMNLYLCHEDKRKQIVQQAYRLVSEELTIYRMTGRILKHAHELHARRQDR